MEFIIGSTNAAKVQAVEKTITAWFPETVLLKVEVSSGVSDQPFGDNETQLGAMNRAMRAAATREGAIGIGLEGGVRMIGKQMYLCNWGVLVLPSGDQFTAGGAQIPLPHEIAMEILRGKELGPVIDAYFKRQGIRSNEGAMGMFTARLVNRDQLFEHIMLLLLGQMKYRQQTP
ncbi:DUF84 family protein [Sporosarcina sp. HYO08]|uniref:DUF84 family protein n=1 Tax=Sporosarcina sp. HYO08 TaxID=1759557 RepID=UPI000798CB72|nr:DUF84 family protein [Sporosarcina sp. HYO08]KXH87154.1 hypothetical protein AU377_00850 [Sporosarcina sp. HYO08]